MPSGRKQGYVVRRCELADCDRVHYGHGYCRVHWKRWKVHGDPLIPLPPASLCEVVGCTRPHRAQGLCASHYKRWSESGVRPDTPISPKIFRGLKGPCMREGCTEQSRGSGYCGRHYSRLTSIINQYGINSFEELDRLWDLAGGRCEICRNPIVLDGPESERAHIDHDHGTGKFRGFLCRACNQGIGQFHDDPELTDAAGVYLRSRRPRHLGR